MIAARLASAADLKALLELFAVSEVSPAVQPLERAERVWRETLDRSGVYVRPCLRNCSRSKQPGALFRGCRLRGRLEDNQQRCDLDAGV